MPRLTTQLYIYRYVVVRVIWTRYIDYFSYLSSRDQSYLHDYYKPDLDLTDDQLVAQRGSVTKSHPALPQQAGRAYAHLMRIAERVEQQPGVSARRAGSTARTVTVRAVRRPQVDTEKLVKALIGWGLQHPDADDHSEPAA